MKVFSRFVSLVSVFLVIAVGANYAVNRRKPWKIVEPTPPSSAGKITPPSASSRPYPSPNLPSFPDPTAPPGSAAQVFIDTQTFDGLIAAVTGQFTDKIHDESSLREYREAIAHRAERAKRQ